MFKSNFIERLYLNVTWAAKARLRAVFNAYSIVLYKHQKSPDSPWKSTQVCLKSNFDFVVFRFDARNDPENASIWSEDSPRGFGPRAHFNPRDISLRIDNIQANEAGLYRCRLDFKRSQTRNVLVNLTVIGKFQDLPKQYRILCLSKACNLNNVLGSFRLLGS